MKILFSILAALLGVMSAARAQNYSIRSFTVDGGGGTSTGGVFTISGTIGQPDAGGGMTNGSFTVTGGFWPGLVQTPGAPTLLIVPAAPGFATISWAPATPGFVLQFTPELSPPAWTNAPSGTTNPVTVPLPAAERYYRLFHP